MRPAGEGVLAVAVRSNRNANYALSMGGAGGFELTRTADNPQTRRTETVVLQNAAGKLENGRWYSVRIKAEGPRLQVWLDGKVLFDLSAAGGAANGQAFVGVRGGGANFAHLSVKRPDGAPLLAGVPTPARHWYAIGAGEIALDTDLPLNSGQSLRMVARSADSGIEQPGYAVRAGDALRGSLWLTGTGPGLVVRLLDGGKVLAEQTVDGPGDEWKEFPLLLNPTANSGNATLRILARAGSDVKLDQVSLMPDSSRANGGFRPDLTQAAAALHPPIIRWPGGSSVGDYRWKDGIGPQSKRVGKNGWDEWDPLSFGIDEFLAFARKVGAEPVIVIWVGDAAWTTRRSFRTRSIWWHTAMVRATARGARSARRTGIPNRTASSIGKSITGSGRIPAADYVNVLKQFVPAMKKVDPSHSHDRRRRRPRGDSRCGATGGLPEHSSLRRMSDRFAEGPAAAAKFWKSLEAEIAGSKNPKLKLFVSEWNAQSTDWRTGLYAGGILNAMERDAAVAMASSGALAAARDGAVPGQRVDQFRPEFLVPGAELRGDETVSRPLRAGVAGDRRQCGRSERYGHAHVGRREDLRQAGQSPGAGSFGRGGIARRFPAAGGRHAVGGSGQPLRAQHDGATGGGSGGGRQESSGPG